jgi:hypothetical protein
MILIMRRTSLFTSALEPVLRGRNTGVSPVLFARELEDHVFLLLRRNRHGRDARVTFGARSNFFFPCRY